jgi:hypothetical protein
MYAVGFSVKSLHFADMLDLRWDADWNLHR